MPSADIGVADVANILRQRQRDLFAHRSVSFDHQWRHIGKQGLQVVRVHHGSAKKIARAAGNRGDAFGHHSASAGLRYRQFHTAHLEKQPDNLLQRFATGGEDRITQLVFQLTRELLDSDLGFFLCDSRGLQVKLHLALSGEYGSFDV